MIKLISIIVYLDSTRARLAHLERFNGLKVILTSTSA